MGRTRFLRPCLAAAGVAAVAAAVAGLVFDGIGGALGAAAGVALAALGFAGSVRAVAAAEKIDIRLTLPVALVTYALKLVVFGIALWAVRAAEWGVMWPLSLGIIGGAIVWLVTQGIWLYRAKIPYIELDRPV